MKYYVETSLENFEAWSGGRDTLDVLIEKGLCDTVEACLEDILDGDSSDTYINDILWMERDMIAEWCGFLAGRHWKTARKRKKKKRKKRKQTTISPGGAQIRTVIVPVALIRNCTVAKWHTTTWAIAKRHTTTTIPTMTMAFASTSKGG